MRSALAPAALAVGLALGVTACGGHDPSEAAPDATTRPALQNVLPGLADLPAGYSTGVRLPSDRAVVRLVCGRHYAPAATATASAAFESYQDSSVSRVLFTAAQYPTAEQARAVVARYARAARHCSEPQRNGERYQVTRLPTTQLGAPAVELRVTTTAKGIAVSIDTVMVAVGDGVITSGQAISGRPGGDVPDAAMFMSAFTADYQDAAGG